MSGISYPGQELEVFAAADVWKRYLARQLKPYLGRKVLEVGAGVGGTTRVLASISGAEWWSLEPDSRLAHVFERSRQEGRLPARCDLVVGTLRDLPPVERFDSVLYIDVLEHVEDDRRELSDAAQVLRPAGHLVVLAPAHPWLFSSFDAAVGHHRRYVKRSLAAVGPPALELVKLRYLDSVGLLASAGNRLVMRSDTPTPRQIAVWDKVLVRLSRMIDPWIGYRLGKSILAVWKKDEGVTALENTGLQ